MGYRKVNLKVELSPSEVLMRNNNPDSSGSIAMVHTSKAACPARGKYESIVLDPVDPCLHKEDPVVGSRRARQSLKVSTESTKFLPIE